MTNSHQPANYAANLVPTVAAVDYGGIERPNIEVDVSSPKKGYKKKAQFSTSIETGDPDEYDKSTSDSVRTTMHAFNVRTKPLQNYTHKEQTVDFVRPEGAHIGEAIAAGVEHPPINFLVDPGIPDNAPGHDIEPPELVGANPSTIDNELSGFMSYNREQKKRTCQSLHEHYTEQKDPKTLRLFDILNVYETLEYAEELSLEQCANDLHEILKTAFEAHDISTFDGFSEGDDFSGRDAKESFNEYKSSLKGATKEVYGDPEEEPYAESIQLLLNSYLELLAEHL